MEIKVGDKVKVAKDAPRMYIAGVGFVFTEIASTVTKIDYPENNPEDQTLRIEITPFNFIEIPSIYVERVENEDNLPFSNNSPEADKILNTAFGRGMAEAIAEKQARIDRLERLIWMLYENIVKGVESTLVDDGDIETNLCKQILDNTRNKMKTMCSVCQSAKEQQDKKSISQWLKERI